MYSGISASPSERLSQNSSKRRNNGLILQWRKIVFAALLLNISAYFLNFVTGIVPGEAVQGLMFFLLKLNATTGRSNCLSYGKGES